jgi:hypothetical protein
MGHKTFNWVWNEAAPRAYRLKRKILGVPWFDDFQNAGWVEVWSLDDQGWLFRGAGRLEDGHPVPVLLSSKSRTWAVLTYPGPPEEGATEALESWLAGD